MSLGGIAVPVYQDAIATELAYVLDHAETSVVVAEDQEQVDKILSLKDQLPHLKLLVYDDPRGLRNYDDPILQSFDAVQAAGREFGAAHPGYVEDSVAAGKPDDLCLFSYTSGTTSRPKGVMLTHVNLLGPAEGFVQAEGLRAERRAPLLSADGLDRQFAVLAGAAPCGSASPSASRKSRRRCGATTASSGRPWRWRRRGCGRTC